ncbi:hypothetical protein OsI_14813 [Oryza sativa Indica Group]|uniref:Uncharacterized protein n=1 Tax=Oryza sativa subsp. indica TaxID=39946 RepID=B8AV08_ORYSI|nr:hypothetical protein OsI_14813 [Oryza sativa Indica Group]
MAAVGPQPRRQPVSGARRRHGALGGPRRGCGSGAAVAGFGSLAAGSGPSPPDLAGADDGAGDGAGWRATTASGSGDTMALADVRHGKSELLGRFCDELGNDDTSLP